MQNKNDPSTNDQNSSEQETPSALPVTEPKAEKSRAASDKVFYRDAMFWLLFFTLLATGAAAYFTFQQSVTQDQTMRFGNRAYVYSANFQFINYGYKPNGTDVQWIVAPLIENTGNTGTHRMMIKTATVIGPINFGVLDQREFSPAVLPPKSDMTAGVIAIDGPKLNEYRMGQLAGIGIIRYDDVFGDPHLEEFCHRAQFSDIDWNGWPAGQPLRVRGVACDDHNCADEHCGPDWRERATGKK